MSIRKNTTPRPLELPPEMRDLLARNGMRGHIAGSSEGFVLLVQGHDSPLLSYPITEKQLQALTDWGTNYANRRCYNTFASIVAADFDLPRDFVHARNANGRVAMGLHGYRIGAGEYGRLGRPVTRNFAASLFRNIKYFTLRKLYLCRKWMQKRLQKTTTTGITLPNFDFLA